MTRAERSADGVAHVLVVLFVAVLALATIVALSDATKPAPRHAPTLGASIAVPAGGGPGAVVVDVRRGGPAQRAGIATGDLLASIDGRTVNAPGDIVAVLAQHRAGDMLTLHWFDATHVYHDADVKLAS